MPHSSRLHRIERRSSRLDRRHGRVSTRGDPACEPVERADVSYLSRRPAACAPLRRERAASAAGVAIVRVARRRCRARRRQPCHGAAPLPSRSPPCRRRIGRAAAADGARRWRVSRSGSISAASISRILGDALGQRGEFHRLRKAISLRASGSCTARSSSGTSSGDLVVEQSPASARCAPSRRSRSASRAASAA